MKSKPKISKFSESEHIDTVGLDRYEAAVGRAMMRLKNDTRLLGAVKLRLELAEQMAFVATGAPRRPFALAKYEARFGRPTQEMQDIVDHYLNTTEEEVDAHG
jgi:hypothetical protein